MDCRGREYKDSLSAGLYLSVVGTRYGDYSAFG